MQSYLTEVVARECPICGDLDGEPVAIHETGSGTVFRVVCDTCGMLGPSAKSADGAILRFNRRAT